MKDHDKLIARLTDQLAVDPELQLDVAQELRGHLEDSKAEFSQAGLTDDQARAEATRALGDPDELAGQLWQANRNRLRIRGLLRWGARITLIPTAIGVIVCLLLSIGVSRNPFGIPESWAEELTEEQMYILRGDPAASTPLERAKSITDRWPDNPVYYGDYVIHATSKEKLYGKLSGAKLKRLLELLAHGKKLDPDNAFYNFTQAAALMRSGCEVGDDESLSYPVIYRDGTVRQKPCYTVTIQDEKLFQQGLAELRLGLAKPRFAISTIEMPKIRQAIIPEHRNVTDVLRRFSIETSTILPTLTDYRPLAKSILGFALAEARKGNADEALLLTRDVERFANHLGANSNCLIELLIAHAIYESAMGNSVQICNTLGLGEQANQFQVKLDENRSFYNEIFKGRRYDEKTFRSAGMYWSVFLGSLPDYTMNFEPMRTAEQFLVNELGLLVLLMILTLLALLMGGITLLELLRRNDRPTLMFVGWQSIGRICLWAIVLPIAIYAAYVQLLTIGPDAFGINFTAGRVILEMIFVGAVVCVLLVGMSYTAIRHRAAELGLVVPQPLTFRRRWLMWSLAGLFILVVMAYLIAWWMGCAQPTGPLWRWNLFSYVLLGESFSLFPSHGGMIIGGAILAFLLAWGLREIFALGLFSQRYRQFRRSVYRNIVPILAAAVIVVGIFCGIVLDRAEASAARRVTGDAVMSIKSEIDRSDFSQMRDRFAARKSQADAGQATQEK